MALVSQAANKPKGLRASLLRKPGFCPLAPFISCWPLAAPGGGYPRVSNCTLGEGQPLGEEEAEGPHRPHSQQLGAGSAGLLLSLTCFIFHPRAYHILLRSVLYLLFCLTLPLESKSWGLGLCLFCSLLDPQLLTCSEAQ